jgi:hypothetical protein
MKSVNAQHQKCWILPWKMWIEPSKVVFYMCLPSKNGDWTYYNVWNWNKKVPFFNGLYMIRTSCSPHTWHLQIHMLAMPRKWHPKFPSPRHLCCLMQCSLVRKELEVCNP